jgi:hypothetical protein
MPRTRLGKQQLDEEAPVQFDSSPCSIWICFAGLFRKKSPRKYEPICSHVTTARRRYIEVGAEMRIRQWILESSLCYSNEFDQSSQTGESPQHISEESDSLDLLDYIDSSSTADAPAGSYPNNPRLPTEVESSTIDNRETRRNRWKARLKRLPVDPVETHATSLPSDTNPQNVGIEPWDRPNHSVRPTTSRLIPVSPPAARAVSAGWMWHSEVLGRRRSSARIAVPPPPPAMLEDTWLVPTSCA